MKSSQTHRQKLEVEDVLAEAWKRFNRKANRRLSGGFGFHAPNNPRASTAFWSRCSGPIDEASSGETSLGVGVGDVLDVGGRAVEGNGLES